MTDTLSPQALRAQAKRNQELRDGCTVHKFDPTEYEFAKPMTCANCGCKVPIHYINPYMQGYIAAGGKPDDVWEGWLESRQRASMAAS